MSKCKTCGRPKPAWVQRLREYAEACAAYSNRSDDQREQGYHEAMQTVGNDLKGMLNELEH